VRKLAGLLTVTLFALCLAGSSVDAAEEPSREHLCTLVGCISGVSIDIRSLLKAMPSAWTVEVGIDNHCASEHLYEPGLGSRAYEWVGSRASAVRGIGPYVVSVLVRDRLGNVLLLAGRIVRMEKHYPNGKDCEGLCFGRGLRINRATHQLELAPKR
jgi:hypothetical protein